MSKTLTLYERKIFLLFFKISLKKIEEELFFNYFFSEVY